MQGSFPHKDTLLLFIEHIPYFYFFIFVITFDLKVSIFPLPHAIGIKFFLKVFLFSFFSPMLRTHSALRGRVPYL